MGAPSGIFNGLERSTVAIMAPPAEVNEAAAGPPPTVDEGSAVVVVLVTPISTASASMRFRLELKEKKKNNESNMLGIRDSSGSPTRWAYCSS